jgi:tetratricopeptide (TPR) repeat protein
MRLPGGALLLAFCSAFSNVSAADDRDAVIQAALKALDAGQAVAALQVLSGHPAAGVPGKVRLIQVRALLALGRHQEAAGLLRLEDAEQANAWPEAQRAAASALAGEIALAGGNFVAARVHLERALRLHGEGVAIDRTMVLLAECCERQGDTAMALRYAHAVWRDWARSPHRGRAGVIEARLIANEQPDQARSVLTGVRTLDHVDLTTRLSAAELLCHLLLPTRPGNCLVVAEQDLLRLPAAGRLPLYRALALAALDAREGHAALLALPDSLRGEPAAVASIARLNASPVVQSENVALRIERARAEIELGRLPAARAMLEPLAATQPAALMLLATIAGVPLERWMDAPAMREVGARAMVGIALARLGDHPRAWHLLEPLVTPVVQDVEGVPPATLLYWAAMSAQQVAPEQVASLMAALLALDSHMVENGIAWAREAQRREQLVADSQLVQMAWERAAEDLPVDHPWQPIAILRAARPLMVGDGGLERAMRLLERGGPPLSEDQRRCRFLLAQAYERLGRSAQALQVIDELEGQADDEQRQKLTRMRARLSTSGTSEVHQRPLDAEN